MIPEVTVDGTTYYPISVAPTSGGSTVQSITSTGSWTAGVAGFQSFRVRESVYTSGTANITIRASASNINVTCIYNCSSSGFPTAPKAKLSIGLGFISGTVSTSTQYPVQPVPAYTNGQLTGLRAASTVADNGTTTFVVYKNGTSVGTLTFANGATTASTTFGTPIGLNAGDVLTLQCTVAGTASNVGIVGEGTQDSF